MRATYGSVEGGASLFISCSGGNRTRDEEVMGLLPYLLATLRLKVALVRFELT